MVAKKGKKTNTKKRIKDLPAKGKSVKGGGFNAYVNFGDIKGESTDKGHEPWIEVISYKRGS